MRPTAVRDHIVRKVLGGPDVEWNYQPLCRECDAYKRSLESQGKAGTWETEAVRVLAAKAGRGGSKVVGDSPGTARRLSYENPQLITKHL